MGSIDLVHVLFSETITTASAVAATQLAAAGHVVHRCHEVRDLGLACSALRGHACPLESEPIDVVVTVRQAEGTRAQPGDDGVFCAVRRHVPVVVAGDAKTHPFLRFTHNRAQNGQALTDVVEAAAADLRDHTAAATAEAKRCAGAQASAKVTRRFGGLHVALTDIGERRDRVAVRVAGVIRAMDPYAKSIDVTAS